MMHGGIYLLVKTEEELQERINKQVYNVSLVSAGLYILIILATFLSVTYLTEKFIGHPWLFVLPAAEILAIVSVLYALRRRRFARAFLSSCASLAILLIFFAVGLFPNLILSRPESTYSLTIYNAASSPKTLKIMLIIAAIGMPLVIAYTISIYRIFRGKVKIDASSY
jgi:cytochrome d ubiquinol oxidase subunit II